MTSIVLYFFLGAVLIPFFIAVLSRKLSWFRRRIEINGSMIQRLQTLAKLSLETMDVPVGAILLYDQTIIGEGYNTVLRNSLAGGHAEINAISSAIASMGYEKFSTLDRHKLILLSTFEPCLMCTGACINYNIPTVYYLEEKEVLYLLRERKSYAWYLFHRIRIQNHGEQLELFKLHPKYPRRIQA